MCLYTYAHALKMYTSYESLHVHVLLIEDLYTCTVPVCVLTLNLFGKNIDDRQRFRGGRHLGTNRIAYSLCSKYLDSIGAYNRGQYPLYPRVVGTYNGICYRGFLLQEVPHLSIISIFISKPSRAR